MVFKKILNFLQRKKSDVAVPSAEYKKNADFETAISATKYGKYNVFLILVTLLISIATIYQTTTMSYVFPAAQCDLNLTLEDKGLLNAVTYLGSITSAFFWGFLCDTMGRKKLIIIGFFADAFIVCLSSLSQSFTQLMILKYFGGLIINGPYAASIAYLSEFHSAQHRSRIPLWSGMSCAFGNIILPLIANGIMPINIDLRLGEIFEFHSWNLFLLICAIPSLVTGTLFLFLPESPKFLMTIGQNEKALEILKAIYSTNTGNKMNSFPISSLVEETAPVKKDTKNKKSKIQAIKDGWGQISPLFRLPHLINFFLVCFLQMFFVSSLNSLRLWLPQIFQVITDYKYFNNGSSAHFCEMLSTISPVAVNESVECFVNTDNTEVYISSMIVSTVTIFGYAIAGSIVNLLGHKYFLSICAIAGGVCALLVNFAINGEMAVALMAGYQMFIGIAGNLMLAIIINLFPTSLRTMTLALAMMSGRTAAMLGNIIFPILLEMSCAVPFVTLGVINLGCGFIAFLLPRSENVQFK